MSSSTRPASLPSSVEPYRTIGPFDAESLPSGLLRTHDLADGVWGLVKLEEGCIRFVWEDGDCESLLLEAPAEQIVPPKAPHHLELEGDFRLTVTFCRATAA